MNMPITILAATDATSHGLVASHVSVIDRTGHVIVDDVSVHARPGRTLVIVGESGAGKSMLARTLCALTPSALSASEIGRAHV
mgnify:CR=1 FL=1